MVPSSVPLVVYANIAGSFIAFDNHVHRVTSKVSLFKFKMSGKGDRGNLLIKLSNCKSTHPVERQSALKQKINTHNIRIKNQPLLKNIYKKPLIISYKRGKSLKDMLVRAKICRLQCDANVTPQEESV